MAFGVRQHVKTPLLATAVRMAFGVRKHTKRPIFWQRESDDSRESTDGARAMCEGSPHTEFIGVLGRTERTETSK